MRAGAVCWYKLIMYGRLLAAVNEHLNSEVAARYALGLARAAGGRLYLCHVREKGASKGQIERAEDALRRLSRRAAEAGVHVESVSERGVPESVIKGLVKSEGIDIAFTATRREDVRRRFYRGTTARRLSEGLPCSVALVRALHMGRLHPGEILVPLKARMGHIPERAFFVAMLAKAFDSKVCVFHAARPIVKFFHGEVHLRPAQWEERLPPDIDLFMKEFNKYGRAPEKRLAAGEAPREISIEAARKRSDLIVMGASERGALSSLMRGNPVERVLRETPCDLIVLRPRHADK